jgi:hypothetical protein
VSYGTPSAERQVQCFLLVEAVYARDHRTLRGYRARWHARGKASGHVMYSSTICKTEERARKLAHEYRHRNPWLIDTSRGVTP